MDSREISGQFPPNEHRGTCVWSKDHACTCPSFEASHEGRLDYLSPTKKGASIYDPLLNIYQYELGLVQTRQGRDEGRVLNSTNSLMRPVEELGSRQDL